MLIYFLYLLLNHQLIARVINNHIENIILKIYTYKHFKPICPRKFIALPLALEIDWSKLRDKNTII